MPRSDGRCNRCLADGAQSRHSFGVYAGFLCVKCAVEGFVDHCGLGDTGQGDPADLDEPLDFDAGWDGNL